jgi:hypothetical protein
MEHLKSAKNNFLCGHQTIMTENFFEEETFFECRL